MKILLISDLHGNWPELQAVLAAEPDVDKILCLGDLVNYGPQPVECVAWAMGLRPPSRVVQGNHDRSFGLDSDPHCAPAYQVLARAVQLATSHLLTSEMRRFLGALEPLHRLRWGGASCVACHAIPSDPLHGYLGGQGALTLWESELVQAGHPDMLFLGNTHVPMKTQFQRTLVVNPGSVGQPKDGDGRAAYAIWQDGTVRLRRAAYDVEETAGAIDRLNVEGHIKWRLAEELRTGGRVATEQRRERGSNG